VGRVKERLSFLDVALCVFTSGLWALWIYFFANEQ
jgi:hypothetical protein